MRYLITGGAGFIGSNLARHLSNSGHKVTVYDNLSRKGTELNIKNLLKQNKRNILFVKADIRNKSTLERYVKGNDVVFHLAGHVSITGSVKNPEEDFEVNARGSLNLLEIVRSMKRPPLLIYSSTNKVYGHLTGIPMEETKTRYVFKNEENKKGVKENNLLDFYTPYGCSKGSADQYFVDYNRIFNIPTIVFRQSCIYGPQQFGVEDQGWVAWFLIACEMKKSINIYGDGKQVRDILHVDDLIRAYMLAIDKYTGKGEVYNIGGGLDFTYSIWQEFKELAGSFTGSVPKVKYSNWRPGDQKIYYSDNTKLLQRFGWKPKIKPQDGVKDLYDWIISNRDFINKIF